MSDSRAVEITGMCHHACLAIQCSSSKYLKKALKREERGHPIIWAYLQLCVLAWLITWERKILKKENRKTDSRTQQEQFEAIWCGAKAPSHLTCLLRSHQEILEPPGWTSHCFLGIAFSYNSMIQLLHSFCCWKDTHFSLTFLRFISKLWSWDLNQIIHAYPSNLNPDKRTGRL